MSRTLARREFTSGDLSGVACLLVVAAKTDMLAESQAAKDIHAMMGRMEEFFGRGA